MRLLKTRRMQTAPGGTVEFSAGSAEIMIACAAATRQASAAITVSKTTACSNASAAGNPVRGNHTLVDTAEIGKQYVVIKESAEC